MLTPDNINRESFLAMCTSMLADTQVDAMFYGTLAQEPSFLRFTHRNGVGEVATTAQSTAATHFVAPRLIEQGIDPLEEGVKFCHEHDMEAW